MFQSFWYTKHTHTPEKEAVKFINNVHPYDKLLLYESTVLWDQLHYIKTLECLNRELNSRYKSSMFNTPKIGLLKIEVIFLLKKYDIN